MIPPRFLDEIRNRLTLSDIIGRRTKVTRAGREFKACCPFHKEKTPSFTINDDKQFYHCFGCGAHGDVVNFVMQHDNLSFMDTVERLAAEAGLQMPKMDPAEAKKAEKQKDLYSLVEETTRWFEQNLHAPENRNVMEYLLGRGLLPETIARFRIGYAPDDRQALRQYLKQQGYQDKDMIEAGVLRPPGKDGQPYAFFRARVMFPVSDKRGRPVAFGGRILPDHLRPPDRGDYTPAKYMNSSDTPLFDKGRMLYGEALARQVVGDGQPLIVTEGYMDVIACHQAGFKGAVAPMGTALTEEQMASLWKMIRADEKTPILCFDGDNAGRRAASRSCERAIPLLQPGQSVKFAFLPDGEDPDTLIKKGGSTAFKKVLDAAMPLFDFIWATQTQGRQLDSPEMRAGLVKNLERQIAQIADPDVQRHYKALIRTKVSENFFGGGQRFNGRGGSQKPKVSVMKPRRPSMAVQDMNVRILLATLINHPQVFFSYEEAIGRYMIEAPQLNRLKQAIVDEIIQSPDLDSEGLKAHLNTMGLGKEISDIACESVYVHASFASPYAESHSAQQRFGDWLREVTQRNWQEINQGWKTAVSSSSEDLEAQLIEMVNERLSET